ncbi:lipid-A-disaccharide synthase [Asticcacaulis sp. EMRT-3]|uniref:lipid-A-disaccharide synthase n=1 Tax=Asticcacaulis sp. EMRT-3 TaxID=3040349 RepID=UPI0024AEB700|nr:lipid-A-disaccharide synthase [Asticcacaulis sp. EMRT-3]MDI7774835.1 lipid-A-disaccharide synthase [Asticcacaulis sp. EMRT-3]
MKTSKSIKVMLVAAEASGDRLAAGLMTQLRAQAPQIDWRFVGVGGARMAEQGVISPFDIAELSIFGLLEGLKAYGRVMRRVRDTAIFAEIAKPDMVVLVDSWGFTLRVAHAIRKIMPDVPLIKYVGPQVWAMRPGRAKTLAQAVDLLLALHPMDAPYFEREGLKTVVVGNPALNADVSHGDPVALREKLGLTADDQMLLVLPGSRPSEIKRLMPVFREVMLRLGRERPGLTMVLPVAETVREAVVAATADLPLRLMLIEDEAEKYAAMQAADLALACSGTVSTELALAGCPMVIAYKVEPLTHWIIRHFATLKYATLFNIMADREIAPEFIQHDCTADKLLRAVSLRLDDKALRDEQVSAQDAALDLMGRGQKPPAEKAARAVLDFLKI